MVKHGWNVILCCPDRIIIEYLDGEMIVVRSDGRTGYGFVRDYLIIMSSHYPKQLEASDHILRKMLGSTYDTTKKINRIYESKLAVISLNCAFGGLANNPHCDISGDLNFSPPQCPLRSICSFNGMYHKNESNLYGCNPIYETNLTERQKEIALLLFETSFRMSEIANIVHLDEERVRNISSEIYTILGVENRQELVCLLRGKRIR